MPDGSYAVDGLCIRICVSSWGTGCSKTMGIYHIKIYEHLKWKWPCTRICTLQQFIESGILMGFDVSIHVLILSQLAFMEIRRRPRLIPG